MLFFWQLFKWDIIFSFQSTGLEYRVRIRGLESGLHGFHVHQYGSLYQADSSSGRCKAAGGHYNPLSQSHGAINDSTR